MLIRDSLCRVGVWIRQNGDDYWLSGLYTYEARALAGCSQCDDVCAERQNDVALGCMGARGIFPRRGGQIHSRSQDFL